MLSIKVSISCLWIGCFFQGLTSADDQFEATVLDKGMYYARVFVHHLHILPIKMREGLLSKKETELSEFDRILCMVNSVRVTVHWGIHPQSMNAGFSRYIYSLLYSLGLPLTHSSAIMRFQNLNPAYSERDKKISRK